MSDCRAPAVFSPTFWRSLCLVCLLAVGCAEALAQNTSGQVMVVTGPVKSFDLQGRERVLQKGDTVAPGDRIVTSENALVQLRMNDGGYLSVRAGTEMKIDQFVFDEKDQKKSSFLVSLIKGGFRSITGLIGKSNPDGYEIRTPGATIGIRGTDHEPMYIPPAASGLPAGIAPGVYDKVNVGETFLRNEHGILPIKPGQVGFSPLKPSAAPKMLQRVPDFYKVDLKIEGRESKERSEGKSDDDKKQLTTSALRPTAASRLSTLNAADRSMMIDKSGDMALSRTALGEAVNPVNPATAPLAVEGVVAPAKTLSGNAMLMPISPALTNATLDMAPLAVDGSVATAKTLSGSTMLAPISSTLTNTALEPKTLVQQAPLTTMQTISPALSPTISPMLSPTITPTTTLIQPAPALIQPTTTLIQPTTILKSTTFIVK